MGGSAVDVQTLQQGVGNVKPLGLSVKRHVYALAEMTARLSPLALSKRGIALVQEITHQLNHKPLQQGQKKQMLIMNLFNIRLEL